MSDLAGIGTIGFVGTGSIAAAMITGLAGQGGDAPTVVVSPRSASVSADLAARFASVRVGDDNAAVVAEADVVILAVRPDQLDEALAGVTFRDGQTVVSLLAGVSIAAVRAAIGADVPVVRAIPLPPVAERACLTPITPGHPAAQAIFDTLGGTLVVGDEAELAVFSALTGAVTGHFQYVDTLCTWATAHGLPRASAEGFVRSMIGSTAPALAETDTTMADVIAAHETAGGLNEQLRLEFFDERTTGALTGALDRLHERVTD